MPSAPLRFCTRHGTASPDGCPDCRRAQERYQQGDTSYNNPRWKRESQRFRTANPFCINAEQNLPDCTLVTDVTDHRIPHEGDERLFWDKKNWQPMCASCHSRKTAEEVGRRSR